MAIRSLPVSETKSYTTAALDKEHNHQMNKFGSQLLVRSVVYTGIGVIATEFAPILFYWVGLWK